MANQSYCTRCGDPFVNDWGHNANYDLNIWFTERAEPWRICVYLIPACGRSNSGYHVGQIELTEEESAQLTLGMTEAEGGDYCGDEDFWIDTKGFFSTFKNIPSRVADALNAFGVYETPQVC